MEMAADSVGPCWLGGRPPEGGGTVRHAHARRHTICTCTHNIYVRFGASTHTHTHMLIPPPPHAVRGPTPSLTCSHTGLCCYSMTACDGRIASLGRSSLREPPTSPYACACMCCLGMLLVACALLHLCRVPHGAGVPGPVHTYRPGPVPVHTKAVQTPAGHPHFLAFRSAEGRAWRGRSGGGPIGEPRAEKGEVGSSGISPA